MENVKEDEVEVGKGVIQDLRILEEKEVKEYDLFDKFQNKKVYFLEFEENRKNENLGGDSVFNIIVNEEIFKGLSKGDYIGVEYKFYSTSSDSEADDNLFKKKKKISQLSKD